VKRWDKLAASGQELPTQSSASRPAQSRQQLISTCRSSFSGTVGFGFQQAQSQSVRQRLVAGARRGLAVLKLLADFRCERLSELAHCNNLTRWQPEKYTKNYADYCRVTTGTVHRPTAPLLHHSITPSLPGCAARPRGRASQIPSSTRP